MLTHAHKIQSTAVVRGQLPLWRATTAGALLILATPAVIAWSLNGIGILVLALTTPMVVSRARGRRTKRLVRFLGWTTYGITTLAAVFMTAGLLLYSERTTVAQIAIVSSSAIYLLAVVALPRLLRRLA